MKEKNKISRFSEKLHTRPVVLYVERCRIMKKSKTENKFTNEKGETECMKDVVLDEFIKERIKENKELFKKEELEYIENNKECINKIYLLGFLNARECYKGQD